MRKKDPVRLPMSVLKNNPCYGCGERAVGCHAACEKYRGWRAGADETAAEIRRKAEAQGQCNDLMIEGRLRAIRKKSKQQQRKFKT